MKLKIMRKKLKCYETNFLHLSTRKNRTGSHKKSNKDNAEEDIEIVNKRISQLENEIKSIQTNQLQNVQSAKSEFSKNKDLSLKEKQLNKKKLITKIRNLMISLQIIKFIDQL